MSCFSQILKKRFQICQDGSTSPLRIFLLLDLIQNEQCSEPDLLCQDKIHTSPLVYTPTRPNPSPPTLTERMRGRTSTSLGIPLSQLFPVQPALIPGYIPLYSSPSTEETVLPTLPILPGTINPQTGLANLRAIDIINTMFFHICDDTKKHR